jgi:hypothetical protein
MLSTSSDTSLGTFKALNNLVIHNGRQGIRWEKVPSANAGGEALIEGNRVHSNNLVAQNKVGRRRKRCGKRHHPKQRLWRRHGRGRLLSQQLREDCCVGRERHQPERVVRPLRQPKGVLQEKPKKPVKTPEIIPA